MACPVGFAHLWQQDKFSDVELAICVPAPKPEPSNADSSLKTTLQSFSAHSTILSQSPIFEAQMLWPTDSQDASQAADTTKKTRKKKGGASASTPAAAAPAKRRVVLTLQSESQQPAALAMLAAMYGVKPVAVLLADLPQEQQLDAAIVADMLQLPAIGDAAVQALVTAAKGAEGLSASLIQHYQQLQLYPACLLPLLPCVLAACSQPTSTAEQKAGVKHVLLSVLGDLEEVWADAALRDTMLQLPLAAMEMLLSYDELKVASEDTVLYTALVYTKGLKDSAQSQTAKQTFAPLVRCPHLSSYWLTLSALSEDTASLVLSQYQPQLRKLLTLHSISGPGYVPSEDDVKKFMTGAPASWLKPRRSIKAVNSVQLVWMVDVAAIRDTIVRSTGKQSTGWLDAPHVSPPLGGRAFGLTVQCSWDAEGKGVKVGVFAQPKHVPAASAYKAWISIAAGSIAGSLTTPFSCAPSGYGWPDFFGLGAMPGGWDEAAWAAKGLPTSGQLKIVLTVKGVGPQHFFAFI